MNEEEEKKEIDIKNAQIKYSLPDWFLQELVSITNDLPGKGGPSITLNTGGIIVSGSLISGKDYPIYLLSIPP